MRFARPSRVLAVLLAAAGLAPRLGAAPPPDPPRRVVVVSFDGAGAAELARQRGALSPDGFLRAEREGLAAERLQTVSPSLTAVVHLSIATGALPSATGVVSNSYWPAGAPLKARENGFDAEPAVETIWEALARQGRRVASLGWPGVSGRAPRTTTPVGFRWTELRAPGFLWSGPGGGAAFPEAAIALPPELKSFSPPRLVRVEPPGGRDGAAARPLVFVLLDGKDDGRREYDALAALASDGSVAARLGAGQWGALPEPRDGAGARGRWVKLLRLAADGSAVSLYIGGVGQTEAWPEDFQRTLDRRCGFWPGPPDSRLLQGPAPDEKTFLEMAERFSAFLTAAFETAERRGDWDLLLAYQPLLDEVGHELIPLPAGSPGWDAVRAERAAAATREAWRMADRAAARYLSFRDRGGDVVLLSDHGLRPVTRSLYPAEVLRREGWIKTDLLGGRPVVRPDSPADVFVTAGSAFVVLNRAGRMPGGVLSPEEAADVLEDIAVRFRSLVDETGAPLFSTVALRGQMAPLGLDHPNAGDLVLLASPGTTLRGGFPKADEGTPLLQPSDLAGQHGYGPDPELDGIFLHVGPGIAPARLPVVKVVEVAPRVAARMGLSPPGAK